MKQHMIIFTLLLLTNLYKAFSKTNLTIQGLDTDK